MEDVLIEEYAKRSGMEPARAKAIWNTLKSEDDKEFGHIKDYLANIVDLSEMAQQLPEGAKQSIMPKIPLLAMGGGSSDSGTDKWHSLAENVLTFREMMKTLEEAPTTTTTTTDKGDELVQKIESLEKKIFEGEQDARFDELKGFIGAMSDKIGSIEETKKGEPAENADVVDSFLGKIEELESKKERFRKVGLLSEPEQTVTSSDDAVKILKDKGYRIEKPTTIADVEGFVAQKVKEKEGELRKQILEGEDRKEQRMSMYLDLGISIVDGILGAVSAKEGGTSSSATTAVQGFRDAVRNAGAKK